MNSPKEKAKQLINRYFKDSDLLYHDLTWIQSKECALIAVEEILKTSQDESIYGTAFREYWMEVKQEIQKI
jgi:preprotein translocase subunit SecE